MKCRTVMAILFLALGFSVAPTEGWRYSIVKCKQSNSNCGQMHEGCNAYKGHCRCGRVFCCSNPFKYTGIADCLVHNKPNDPCNPKPCKNNGYCVQVGSVGSIGYRCMCHGTGFYGRRCNEKCPYKVLKTVWKSKNKKKMRELLACVTL